MNKYNLTDLLSNEIVVEEADGVKNYKFDGIQIPMIQRDYAQGRKEEGEIRKRFLKSIFNALEKNDSLELDFIYGSIETIGNKNFFIPLDGQQRLTTLFLLHWYIANRELGDTDLIQIRESLKQFTYTTRISARDFCNKISQLSLDFSKVPSDEIKNAAWFYDAYKKDPTVKSMLVMLDAIHENYGEKTRDLYRTLSNLSFYILPLDGFNLSDELYIKMNARGKQLTDFENFKADLIGMLQDDKNTNRAEYNKEVNHNGRNMPYHLSFGLKFDNDWTNLFWNISKKHKTHNDKIVDPYFMRFIHRYLLNSLIIQSNATQDRLENDEVFRRFYSKTDANANEIIPKYESFEPYLNLLNTPYQIVRLENLLDKLSKHYDDILPIIKPNWENESNWSFLGTVINQRQRILFFAITRYLELNDFSTENLRRWIRVVWNIIIDPDIRSIPAMISAMRLINKIAKGSGDIYNFLLSDECLALIDSEKSFAKAQLEEERLKAELIHSDPVWEEELINIEKHPLLLGNIKFLLLGNPDLALFKHRSAIAFELFSSKGAKGEFGEDHLLIRAVISMFNSWNNLYNLSFADDYNNWQFIIRRDATVQKTLCDFCSLADYNAVVSELKSFIATSSYIDSWSESDSEIAKAQHIHEQLYQDTSFHHWLQDHKAVNLKWLNHHVYVHRPRSWYDWVMLDTFRNELITYLIKRFSLNTTQKCGSTNYFWGYPKIDLHRSYTNFNISIEFDDLKYLRIGVKDDGHSALDKTMNFNADEQEEGWLCRKKYNYTSVKAANQIPSFTDLIEQEIFNETNGNSLIYRLCN